MLETKRFIGLSGNNSSKFLRKLHSGPHKVHCQVRRTAVCRNCARWTTFLALVCGYFCSLVFSHPRRRFTPASNSFIMRLPPRFRLVVVVAKYDTTRLHVIVAFRDQHLLRETNYLSRHLNEKRQVFLSDFGCIPARFACSQMFSWPLRRSLCWKVRKETS